MVSIAIIFAIIIIAGVIFAIIGSKKRAVLEAETKHANVNHRKKRKK